jgi:hypothetical protein
VNMSFLATELSSSSSVERRRARVALAELGTEAIPALTRALSNASPLVRQEAVKALEAIGDDAAAKGLIQAMQDPDAGVRWLAAESLAHLGPVGLRPLLGALICNDRLIWLREGAHHVLHFYAGELNRPLEQLMSALEESDASIPLTWDARVALDSLPSPSTHL